MLSKLLERLRWTVWGRRAMRRRVRGFAAGPFTYATPDCGFGENAALWGTAQVFRSSLGRFSYVTSGRVVEAKVGAFTSIGPGVLIGGFGRHPTRWLSTHPAFYSTGGQAGRRFVDKNSFDEAAPVNIGSDVWIGTRAMVLDGVTIGDGAIVAASSVVTRDVKPYEVVGGVPARLLRMRFEPAVVDALLVHRWWLLDEAALAEIAPLMRSEDPAPLLTALAARPALMVAP